MSYSKRNQDRWEKHQQLSNEDDTILMAESEEDLKSLLMRVKEESERASLKPSITKTKIMAYPAPLLYGKQKGKSGSSDRFAFLGL